MPELPEVHALTVFLTEQAGGKAIERLQLAEISALKTYDPPLESLAGRTVQHVGRRGKYLIFETDGPYLVIHLARGGWIRWQEAMAPGLVKRGKGPLALRVRLVTGEGFDVTEQGTEKRLAVWVVNDPADIEAVATLGPDALAEDFDAAALGKLLEGSSAQIKHALTDQSLIAGVGNAYSDEALHLAKLSPYRQAGKLTPGEVERLHAALRQVLGDALERSAGLPAAGLKSEKKSGMRVHGRTGQPCPECGDTVREVSFATKSMQYCPTCQTGGKPLADRRLSRLLK
jgi:formamidopyrimidine-DNA glycosylase